MKERIDDMLGESLFSQYRHNSFLFLVVVGLSIVNIGIFLYQTYLAFTVPARFGYVEPYVVYHGTHWEMLYAPIAEPPYIQTVFPPVYLILTGIVDAVFNSPLFSGRLISFVSTVSTAVIISLIVCRSSSGKKDTAALAGVIYISSPYVTSSGVIASPDNLGIAISVAALYWFLTREGYGKIIASAVACALALLTKQSLIGAPAAIFFSLIYKKEFKKAAVFFTLVSLIGFCVLATLNYVTNGRAWFHIVEYNTHNLSAALLIETTYFFITRHTATLIVASLAAVFYFDEIPPVLIMYATTTGLLVVLAAKVGSDVQYYYPLISSMAILGGIYLSYIFPSGIVEKIKKSTVSVESREIIIALTLVSGVLLTGISPPNDHGNGSVETAKFLTHVNGDVLAEDAGVLMLSNRAIHYQPYAFGKLIKAGTWNQSQFVDSIQQQQYEYIVLTSPANSTAGWFTKQQRRAVDQNYTLYKRFGGSSGYYVYKPRGAQFSDNNV